MRIIGKDSWKEAAAIMTYQLRRETDGIVWRSTAVFNDEEISIVRETDFLLCKEDIPQLISNERFFKHCATKFAYHSLTDGPRSLPPRAITAPTPAGTGGDTTTAPLIPSPSMGGFLTKKLFYEMWLLNMRFQQDRILTFSRRPALTSQQFANFASLARAIVNVPEFRGLVMNPPWKSGWPEWRKYTQDLFTSCYRITMIERMYSTSNNPVLRFKMWCHFHEKYFTNLPTIQDIEAALPIRNAFLRDLGLKSTEALVKEYNLDDGFE